MIHVRYLIPPFQDMESKVDIHSELYDEWSTLYTSPNDFKYFLVFCVGILTVIELNIKLLDFPADIGRAGEAGPYDESQPRQLLPHAG